MEYKGSITARERKIIT